MNCHFLPSDIMMSEFQIHALSCVDATGGVPSDTPPVFVLNIYSLIFESFEGITALFPCSSLRN